MRSLNRAGCRPEQQTGEPQASDFYTIGHQAFENGELSAPVLNPEVQAAIADLPVGGGAANMIREFNRGWTAANLEAPVERLAQLADAGRGRLQTQAPGRTGPVRHHNHIEHRN